MKEKFTITGMTCSACSSGIEKRVCKLDGVLKAEVSLMGESMTVDYDGEKLNSDGIMETVVSLGYGIKPFDNDALKSREPEQNTLKKRFFISLAFLLPS